jgi:hypothetical protein
VKLPTLDVVFVAAGEIRLPPIRCSTLSMARDSLCLDGWPLRRQVCWRRSEDGAWIGPQGQRAIAVEIR